MKSNEQKTYKASQLAKKLNISQTQVYILMRKGEIESIPGTKPLLFYDVKLKPTEKKVKKFTELENEIIEYFKTNKENSSPVIAEKFNVKITKVNNLINRYYENPQRTQSLSN